MRIPVDLEMWSVSTKRESDTLWVATYINPISKRYIAAFTFLCDEIELRGNEAVFISRSVQYDEDYLLCINTDNIISFQYAKMSLFSECILTMRNTGDIDHNCLTYNIELKLYNWDFQKLLDANKDKDWARLAILESIL